MKIYRFWNDRRSTPVRCAFLGTIFFLLIWYVALSYAANVKPEDTGTDSLIEHARVIMGAQMYVILALAGGFIGMVSWIFLYIVQDIKRTVRANHADMKEVIAEIREHMDLKLDKADHDRICSTKK
jgi:hypothetical protein